ncbi:hypothetical protein BGZ50_008242, partial [Haplosporangium sp. Z 11]
MSFFKRSSKNKTSSGASTPSQTPRSSMQAQRGDQATKMTLNQALEMVMDRSMPNAGS